MKCTNGRYPMYPDTSPRTYPVYYVSLALLGFLTLLALVHYIFVVEALDYANKDFMSLWTGGKALLAGQSPYDPNVWRAMRTQFGSSWFPDDRAPFPLWTFVFTTPFALLPIPLAAALWMALTELALAASVFLVVRYLAGFHLMPLDSGLLLLGVVASIATILVLINGQMTAFLLAILVGYLLLRQRERLFTAGLLLALVAMKPNAFIAFVPLVGVWLLVGRHWRVIAGGLTSVLVMVVVTWLIQPGWLFEWLNVREKTVVVTTTPTLWGLAAELAGDWWLPVGLLLTVLTVSGVGWYFVRHKELGEAPVVSLALAASLLTTPYTWSYEHALLFLPLAWAFALIPRRKMANTIWLGLAFLVPWLLFAIAATRINDSFGWMSPLLAIIAVLYAERSTTGKAKA